MTFANWVELAKLRIGVMIALTAVVAYVAVAETVRLDEIIPLVVVMLLGSASSAVFNHYHDRDIDRRMARTSGRPLARDLLGSPGKVLWLAALLLAIGVGLSLWLFNGAVALHLFLGAFFYGVVYTVWLKRRTWLNIVLGGLAGSFAVLAGAAVAGEWQGTLPLMLALVLFFWTPSHFWSLAIHLKEEYGRVGVPMLPVVVGRARAAKFVLLNSVLLVVASLMPWVLGDLGGIYLGGAILSGSLILLGNWRMVRLPTPEMGWANFMGSMRYLGMLFLAICLDVSL
ncbi:MAG: protoheme IX farnesyltransferase [Magnetococcales bacterium]|nr:protoheme IX farnesyltransferase [Magnetococcales bacterium]MBF0156562.1 protoheme IX farnesyltransferase [Magnetococcales bacterium]